MKKAFDNDEMSDLLLILSDGSSLFAHLVILAARCPSLLPSSYLISKQNKGSLGDGLLDQETTEKVQKKVYREMLDYWRSVAVWNLYFPFFTKEHLVGDCRSWSATLLLPLMSMAILT